MPLPRVLLLDDEATTRALLKIFLMQERVELVDFAEPAAALAAVKLAPVALAIIDFNMPGMDGLEVLQALRALDGERRTPVVLLTGDLDHSLNVRARAHGVDEFLRKPVTPDLLRAVVKRYVS